MTTSNLTNWINSGIFYTNTGKGHQLQFSNLLLGVVGLECKFATQSGYAECSPYLFSVKIWAVVCRISAVGRESNHIRWLALSVEAGEVTQSSSWLVTANIPSSLILLPWRWRPFSPPKRWFWQDTLFHIPEGGIFHNHPSENLSSYNLFMLLKPYTIDPVMDGVIQSNKQRDQVGGILPNLRVLETIQKIPCNRIYHEIVIV
jgi:hypothetical protein